MLPHSLFALSLNLFLMSNFITSLIGPSVVLKRDIVAGITGAVLVIPQGIAYAIIAGLPPEIGLYTAIFSALIASLFGSSRHMVSGSTAALSIVSAVVLGGLGIGEPQQYVATMCLLSLLVGIYQLMFWLIKAGGIVNFISHSVVQGFTSGRCVSDRIQPDQ